MTTLLDFLATEMTRPIAYQGLESSWFQYLTLLVWLSLIVYTWYLSKHYHEEKATKAIFYVGLILLAFEIYKQVVFTYEAASFQWYAFPFQFCSTPMYIMIIQRFTRGRTKKALWMYLQTYGFFAGVAVMFYPVAVFHKMIGINIQTMVHHGAMSLVGFYLVLHAKPKIQNFLDASFIFLMLTMIAVIMNGSFNLFNHSASFNMFFLNPKFQSHIPVISLFQAHVSSSIYIVIFIVGFSCIGYFMYLMSNLWHKSLRLK